MNNYVLENKSKIPEDLKAEKLDYHSSKVLEHLLIYNRNSEENRMESMKDLEYQQDSLCNVALIS